MINAALLSKINCQKLALGILSYLHEKCSKEVFPRKEYYYVKKSILETNNFGFLSYKDPILSKIYLKYKIFEECFDCFVNWRDDQSFCLNTFQNNIRLLIPTGVIQAIYEDNQLIAPSIKQIPDIKNIAVIIINEETYSELPYLADACEEYGYLDYANHFRNNELVHTLTCPFLQSIWRA